MLTDENKAIIQKHLPFWDKLSQSEKELISQNASEMTFEKGAHIYSSDGGCVGLMIVKSGHLRAYMMSEEGKDITLYRLFDEDVCIMSAACALNAITFDVFVDAEEESRLLIVTSGVFNQIFKNNIYVEAYAYNLATARFSDVMWAMQQILFMSADRRLAVFLVDELAKSGGDTVKMTQEQIAKYMGSAREVVSRLLKYFSSEGIVEVSRGGIKIIDKKKLRSLC